MRTTIRTLSLLAPFVTLFLGAIFNFMSLIFSFGMASYNSPVAIISTSIGLIPGVALAMIGLIMGITDGVRNHRGLWIWGQLLWPLIIVLFAILFFNNYSLGPFWWTVVAILSLPALLYGFLAPVPSAPMPGKNRRQVSFVAILSGMVIVGIILILTSPSTRPTYQYQSQAPVLTANTTSTTTDCVNGTYPLITLQNVSGNAVKWSAKNLSDPTLTISPANGTLAANGTITVTISGKTAGSTIVINFDDAAGTPVAVVKLGCGPGPSK